jgi:trimeric autotransporter adhesin
MRRLVTIAVIGVLSFVSNAAFAQQPTFSLAPATTNTTQGSQVCLDLVVSNFTNLVSFQFSINFTAAVLNYDMAQGFGNLPGFTAASVGNPSAGNLTMNWLANDPVAGQSLADGTKIAEFCFTAIPQNGTATLNFSGTPTPIEVTNPNGELTPVFGNATIIVGDGSGGGGGGGGGGGNGLTFIASEETAASGSQVCVDISVEDFMDIVSMQFSINYNPSVLSFNNATGFNLPGMGAGNVGNPTAGNITVSWEAQDPINGQDMPNGAVIFQLCFTVTGGSGSSSNITFSGTPVIIEVIGAGGPVTPAFDHGKVTVTGGGGGGTNLTFSAANLMADPGTQVCVPVTVQNFNNIVSFQYSINFNASVLTYTGAQNFNLPGFSAANLGNPSAGNISVSWLANDPVTGQSVPNGTVIFELCFNVIGSAGAMSPINFSGSPVPIEVSNPSGLVTPVFNNGSVTVSNTIDPSAFALFLSNANVQSGDNFCIDLSVQNFTSMVSMQFSINYPGNLLSFTGAQGFNLQGLSAANIGNPGGPTSGNITLSWLTDDFNNGETVPDGTTIVQLCFQAIGPNCSTANIVFSGVPTPIEVTDLDGPVPFNWIGSTVSICDAQPLIIAASSEIAAPGGTACVKIRAIDGFTNITSLQFSLSYINSIVNYTSVQNINLPGMTAANVANPMPGQLTFSWTSAGISIPDNTVLFELCFTAVGSNGQMSPVNFTNMPLASQAANANGAVPFVGNNGSITINGNCPPIVIEGQTSNSCAGNGTGDIELTVSGGDGSSYSYSWSNNATSQNLSNVSAGTYTVTVTSCGLSATESFTVGAFPDITINPIIVDVACFGNNTGAIFLTLQGTAPFSYSWSGPGVIPNPNAQNITDLVAGDYTVTITDGNGCIKVSNILVKQPTAALTANLLNITPVSCFGLNDGGIQVQVLGGTSPYIYNWVPGLPNTPTPTGLSAGSYSLEVVDNNSCTVSLNDIVVSQPQLLSVQLVNLTNETGAGNNGAIDITVTGGTGPYNYLWQGPGGPYATQDLNNLTAGTYDLTVTDANGCIANFSINVVKPLEIDIDQIIQPCGGDNDGAIFITVTGGEQPFAYFWTGPGGPYFSEDITGLGGGTYSLTVTDIVGTQATLQVTLVQPAQALEITSATVNNPTGPSTCNGAIVLNTIVGGTPPYTFNWSNTATTPSIFNLCSASYTVTVTDANGCTYVETFNPQFVPFPIIPVLSSSQNVKCHGEEDGIWTISIEGGVSPYTFTYSDGFSTLSLGGVVTRNDLPAGMYSCTITDSANPQQQLTLNRTITQPPPFELSGMLIYPATGISSNGAVDITPTGGTLPYNYLWSNGFMGPDPVNLADNCYTLTVGDGAGCNYVFDDICVPRFQVSGFTITDNFCNNDANGAIIANVSGGINPPLTYTWIGPGGQQIITADSNLVSNLPSGQYSVYVTDALGVTTVIQNATVGFTSEVEAEAYATSNFNGFAVSCPGQSDGAAEVVALSGVSPFSYQWLGGLGSQPSVSGLGEGVYTVVVSDNLGCNDTVSVTLSAPLPPAYVAQISPVVCAGEGNGRIFLNFPGGAGGLNFSWNDFKKQKTNPAIFLSGGEYTVTITYGNGCQQVSTFDVEEPAPLQVNVLTTPDDGVSNGSIAALVSGGAAPYTYQWNTGRPGDSGSLVENLSAGEYAVLVTDANGCSTIAVAIVSNSNIDCLEFRNVITPDGDGLNETFQINCLNLYQENNLRIFNRWGQLVFEQANYANDWTGINRLGEELPEGAYFFVFEYRDEQGAMQQMKGHITLIRQ